MHAFSTSRLTRAAIARAAIGLAAVSAFALAPMAAQAAGPGDLTGTLGSGGLTNTAPDLTDFGSVALTGAPQSVYTPVGSYSVTDLTGSNAGYTIAVIADAPTVNGSTTLAGTSGSIALTPTAMSKDAGNPFPDTVGPVATDATRDVLPATVGYTIDTAAAGHGQGLWATTADNITTPGPGVGSGHASGNSLKVVIPADASAGSYASLLTFTSAPTVP